METSPRHVCFTPDSGHSPTPIECPLCANSGHRDALDKIWPPEGRHYALPLKAATWTKAFSSCVGDETSRCRSPRTCIRSGHACIDEVASEARYCPDIRYRTVLARFRTRPVLAKCERRVPSRVCAHSEAHAVSGRFETDFVHRALLKEHWYPVAAEKCAQAEIQDSR